MINKIRVEREEDSLFLVADRIHAVVHSEEHIYELSPLNKMVLYTTDIGPSCDDMGLAIYVENNDVIYIMSEHKCYIPFLFDQVGKVLPIDFQNIIEASTCTDNGIFEIYVREV